MSRYATKPAWSVIVKTNEAGYYTVTNIPSGVYSVAIVASGFKKFDSNNNKLDPSSVMGVDVVLTVGAATETVEVTASAARLQTESAVVSRQITREQIDALELNGRNPVGLLRWSRVREAAT